MHETEWPVVGNSDVQLLAEEGPGIELETEPETKSPDALASMEASSLSYMAQFYEEVGCSN